MGCRGTVVLVSRSNFDVTLELLLRQHTLSLDCETTGLRPYHGSRLFSLILAHETSDGIPVPHYFNFWASYEGLDPDFVLTREHLLKLAPLFSDASRKWYIHRFNFDMHVLGVEGLELAGEVFCTLTQGRVEHNEYLSYDLDSSLTRIGLKKDDAVEKWITDHKAFEHTQIPGKKIRKKNKFFYKVPYDIIVPYGCSDALGGFALGQHLEQSIRDQSREYPAGRPNLESASQIETRLAKTVYRMEKVGAKMDRAYVTRALAYEADRLEKASLEFVRETHREYAASPKLFASLFESEKARWVYTEKGNPSFESDVIKKFDHPAAKIILRLRAAKSKLDFYHGFLYHADENDIIHAQFNPGGTRTLRFSSAEPNLQNMTSEEATQCRACREWTEQLVDRCPLCDSSDVEHPEFLVRRAFIPRPGFVFVMPDYDQMEYKLMLEYAKLMMIQELTRRKQPWSEDYFEIANRVAQGYDVHKATAELIGFTRKAAKAINFGLLYGEGVDLLALNLGVTREQALEMKAKYFRALPYVQFMISSIQSTIKTRGWVRNWAGYKYNFPDRNFAYKGPNTVVQGGCAAVAKVAMNRIDELLLPLKSRMVLSIHDEFPTEVHESEMHKIPSLIKEAMERVYPYKYVPLTVGMEWSDKSLADKKKGLPA